MTAATDLIHRLPGAFDASAAADADCTIQLNLSRPMHLIIRNGHCQAGEGDCKSPDTTVTISDEDFVALMTGELNGMTAFMTGKLTVDGDLMLAQRITTFFDVRKLG